MLPKFLWTLLLALAGISLARADGPQKTTFYVQLIQGSDADKPDNPAWKPVGAKLGKNLRAVFRWKNYWEVKRQSVALSRDKGARLHLTPERELEVKLLDPPKTQIRLYHKGQLTRCSHQPINEHMCVLGGDSAAGDSWFVVVRRDKPPDND
jgi:hypothetical protein